VEKRFFWWFWVVYRNRYGRTARGRDPLALLLWGRFVFSVHLLFLSIGGIGLPYFSGL